MIDFTPTPEQQALVGLAHDFVERHVKPLAAEKDRLADPAACFPWEVVDKAAEVGLKNLALTKKYGGGEADSLTLAMLIEELGRGDLGVATIFMQLWEVSRVLQNLASEEQRQRFLIPFRDDPRFLFAIGLTEPESGSDHILPYDDPAAGAKLSARIEDNRVVLNGTKHFISVGDVAKLYLIFARTDRSVGITRGLTVFLVPAGVAGFTIGHIHDKVGQRLCTNAELVFRNCRIPRENQLTPWNQGMTTLAAVLRESGAHRAACFLGVARAIFEYTLEWAKTRVQGGKPIIEHQAVAMALAEMWMGLELARNIIWKAAWAADYPQHFDPKLARIPKLFTSELTVKVATDALRLSGGYGIMKEMGLEKLVRDALTSLHSQGPNDVIKTTLGKLLGSAG